jgi:hypothetical protein
MNTLFNHPSHYPHTHTSSSPETKTISQTKATKHKEGSKTNTKRLRRKEGYRKWVGGHKYKSLSIVDARCRIGSRHYVRFACVYQVATANDDPLHFLYHLPSFAGRVPIPDVLLREAHLLRMVKLLSGGRKASVSPFPVRRCVVDLPENVELGDESFCILLSCRLRLLLASFLFFLRVFRCSLVMVITIDLQSLSFSALLAS